MNRLLENIFGIRREERGLALLMALYHYVLLITFYLLKPVRDSLFLSERGAAELPFVFILTTAIIVPVAALHARAGQHLKLSRLVDSVSILLAVGIVVLRWFVLQDGIWVSYVLYAWVSIYGVLVTSQFWLLANGLFDSAQSKRIFPLLSLGAILGAVTGGEVTNLLVEGVGVASHNLLWLAAGLLVGSVGLAMLIRHRWQMKAPAQERALDQQAEEAPDAGLAAVVETLRNSRHLMLIVGVIALTVVTTTFVDFQFKTVAARAFPDEAALTSFMGRFYGRVSLVALVLQFFIAPYLIRILGVGGAISLLPVGLAVGAMGMLFAPGLVAGVLMRGTEQSLKHSVDRTGRELLFVPVDLETKKRVKVFVDLFVSKGTQGIGGLLLVGLTWVLDFSMQQISAVVLVLIGAWGLLAYLARQSYIDQFRQQLRAQDDYGEEEDDAEEEAKLSLELNELLRSLCSRGENEALQALAELEKGDMVVPVEAMRCLLDHRSATIRATAIRVLRRRRVNGLGEDVAPRLTDENPAVQLEAARYMHCDVEGDRCRRLEKGLQHEDPRIRAATVGLIAEDGGPAEHALVSEEMLRELLRVRGERGVHGRVQVARLLGIIDRPYRNEMLHRLLEDDDSAVVRQAVASAGQVGDRGFVLPVLRRLKQEAFEETARQALVDFGRRILGTLYDHLVDEHVALEVRARIPSILAREACQEAVSVLMFALEYGVPVPVRHAIVKALSKLHADDSRYDFDMDVIEDALRTDAEYFATFGQVVYLQSRTDHPSAQRIPREKLQAFREESLERVFRLLGLRYDQRDIYDAYRGITSDDPALRSSAVEFVDNLVEWTTSRYLLPLLDDPDGRQAMREAPALFDVRLRGWTEALTFLLNAPDPRLNTLVQEHVDGTLPDELIPLLEADRAPAPPEAVS